MNPTIKKFLADNKDVTVLGLYWAGFWRFMLCYFAFFIGLGILIVAFGN